MRSVRSNARRDPSRRASRRRRRPCHVRRLHRRRLRVRELGVADPAGPRPARPDPVPARAASCSRSRPVRSSRCRCPGLIIARFGSRRTVAAMALLLGGRAPGRGCRLPVGVVPVAVGLFVFGFANGAWDVAMNVQGAVVEQRLGRAIMSRFHAGFSLGTVGGALVGAGMVALGVSVTAHLAVVGVVVAVVVAVRRPRASCPTRRADGRRAEASAGRRRPAAWREPRTAADRRLRAGLRVRRGHGQRLDQRRAHRRLRRPRRRSAPSASPPS